MGTFESYTKQKIDEIAQSIKKSSPDVLTSQIYPQAGLYIQPVSQSSSEATTVPIPVNSTKISPQIIAHKTYIDAFSTWISVTQPGSEIRFVLYDSTENGLPKDLIYATEPISCASTGAKEVFLSNNLVVEPGLYWIGGYSHAGTPSPLCINTSVAVGSKVPIYRSGPIYNSPVHTGYIAAGIPDIWPSLPVSTEGPPIVRYRVSL